MKLNYEEPDRNIVKVTLEGRNVPSLVAGTAPRSCMRIRAVRMQCLA